MASNPFQVLSKTGFALIILLAACWGTPAGADEPLSPGTLFSSGPLCLEMTQEELLQVLGPPTRQIEPWFNQGPGTYKKEWLFPELGVQIALTGAELSGPFKVQSMVFEAPWQKAVANGVTVGMSKQQARQNFEALESSDLVTWHGDDPRNFGLLLNSTYTIIALSFESDAVRRIYVGPGPGH